MRARVGGLIGTIDTGGRVCYFPRTDEAFPLDDTVVLDLAEGTLEGVGGGLNIDTTTDITDRGERSVVKCPCPIDGTTDGRNLIESGDVFEVSVVGYKECSADGGEFWE